MRIYPSLNLFDAAATISGGHARCANIVHIGSVPSDALYTTWEIAFPDVPATLWLRIRRTAVPNATAISTLTWTIWHCPKAIIRIEWFRWQYDLWLKMVCRIEQLRGIYGVTTGYLFPGLQFKTGLKQRGKKAEVLIKTDYIDKALSEFSGYIAADELYDGPFCVLFIVDNHKFKRLYYEVLEHNPANEDITRFFRRFKQMLDAHDLALKGITTDGSPLYPEPIAEVFGKIKHQSCRFHIIKEITRDILKAVTQVRRQLKQKKTKRLRGRPCGQRAKQVAQKNKRLQKRIADLFEHRYLFVRRSLTHKEKKTFLDITRGLDPLRNLRAIMDEVYRLFDRRCRMDTALEKLAKLRRRIRRFVTLRDTLKKLSSSNLEKALTFLDDSLLPATSNAVERANRRHRKMQKSIYRVRTRDHISQRIAVDMQRDIYIDSLKKTIGTLHWSRSGEKRKAG
ncbi:MAG: transposase [bacterium]